MYVVLVLLDKSFNFNCAYIFPFEKMRGHVIHIFSCLVGFLGLWWSKYFLCTFLMIFMKRILSLLILQIALAHKNWTSNWNLRSYNSSLWWYIVLFISHLWEKQDLLSLQSRHKNLSTPIFICCCSKGSVFKSYLKCSPSFLKILKTMNCRL